MFERLKYCWKYWWYFPTRWRYALSSDWIDHGWAGAWSLVEEHEQGRDVDLHMVNHYEHKDTGEDKYIYGGRRHRQYVKESRFRDSSEYGGSPEEWFHQRLLLGGTAHYQPIEERLTHDL